MEPEYNTYKTYYIAEPQGGFGTGGTIYVSFPSPYWATDTDFTGYDFDDDETGINSIGQMDNLQLDNLRADAVYDLQGRKIAPLGGPQGASSNHQLPKGMYINNGKKIIVK